MTPLLLFTLVSLFCKACSSKALGKWCWWIEPVRADSLLEQVLGSHPQSRPPIEIHTSSLRAAVWSCSQLLCDWIFIVQLLHHKLYPKHEGRWWPHCTPLQSPNDLSVYWSMHLLKLSPGSYNMSFKEAIRLHFYILPEVFCCVSASF